MWRRPRRRLASPTEDHSLIGLSATYCGKAGPDLRNDHDVMGRLSAAWDRGTTSINNPPEVDVRFNDVCSGRRFGRQSGGAVAVAAAARSPEDGSGSFRWAPTSIV